MKIYLSTFFNNGNLGSELQATSLCAFLKENGYNDIVLIKKKNNSFLRKVFNRVYVNYKKIFLNRDMKKMILVKEIHTKNHCLLSDKTKILIEEYSKNNFRTYCGNNIKKLICKEAIFICGSDQIWSPLIFCNNEFYFLKKVPKSKKIAYAVSFGVEKIPDFYFKKNKNNIIDFIYLSFIEPKSISLIENKFAIKGKYVCDPVFLNNYSWWTKMSLKSKLKEQNYILLYFLDKPNNEVYDFIEKKFDNIQKKYICYKSFFDSLNNSFFIDVNPYDFLYLINNAKIIITDSFHAVALSLIYKKDFRVFSRNQPNELKQESRISSLLDLVNLQSRLNNFSEELTNIDYGHVSELLNPFIERSKLFLIEALSNIKNNF